MNAHIVVGDGVWPIDTVLRHALSPERRREVIVLDLQGRGAGRLTDALRAELRERLQVWLDLAERRAPRAPWRYRPSEQGDRSLRFLVQGWAASVGVEVPVVEVQALVAMARALGTIARDPLGTAPSLSLVDVVRTLRNPPHPLLMRRIAESADVEPMRLRPLLDAIATALRYPAVYASVSSTEAVPPPKPAGVTWIELPRAHLEPVEWQLLARLAVAAAMESCASRDRPVVVVIDPARGAGSCVDPAWFSGADAVYGAWTPTGDGSEAVLRPWAPAKAWIARNRLRPNAWENLIAVEAHAALRSLSEYEMLATALRPDAPWTRHRFRAPEVLEAPPRERLRRPESAPTHLADAAVEAMRERTVPRGLLPRIASMSSLRRAWHRVRTGNIESFGTDFVSARTFEIDLEPALLSLRAELLDGTYRPLPLRRVNLPKPEGGTRPIGIVTTRNRIAQTACLDAIDPLLDATFSEHSYAFRHRRGAPLAVLAAMDAIRDGARWLLRCDIAQCFDSLDHEILFGRLRDTLRDEDLLHLLGLWARAEILVGEDILPTEIGIAQGTILAPLLCNLYLTPLDRALEAAGVTFVRYADDILALVADEAAAHETHALIERTLGSALRLRLNPRKTVIASADAGVDHLGFRLASDGLDIQGAKIDRLLDEVRQRLADMGRAHAAGALAVEESFRSLLAALRGFANYYQSVGDAPRVHASLLRAGRAVHAMALEALPPTLLEHPTWARRDALWRGEAPERGEASTRPAGTYAERSAPSMDPGRVAAPESAQGPAASQGAPEPLAGGVLLEDGSLHVLRHGAYLTLRDGALVVRGRGAEVERISLSDIRTVTLSGRGTSIASSLAQWLARAGVPILVGTPSDTEFTLITSPSPGVPRVRAAQAIHRARADVARCGLEMLHGKVSGQASVLRYYAKYRRRRGDALHTFLDESAARIREASRRILDVPTADWDAQRKVAMGHEGVGAAIYWEAVARMVPPELGFSARITRGATDPLNQSLNYAYGCLYAEVWRAVQQAGLDPYLGIVHGSERGDASLVFDLVEELRPNFADRLIFSLLGRGFRPKIGARGVLSTASRRMISRAFHRCASRGARWRGSRKSLTKIALGQARTLRAVVLGESLTYRAFHLRW